MTQSRPLASKVIETGIFQVGELDLGGEQVDRVALRASVKVFASSSGVVMWIRPPTLVFTLANSPVPLSSIVAGTAFPWAMSQIRRSRFWIILRSLANSAGKLTMPKGAFRPP